MAAHIKAVLFDLDGTLLDTAPDLTHALNHVLSRYGQKQVPLSLARTVASDGSKALLELGFGSEVINDANAFSDKQHCLLDHYHANVAKDTVYFDGIEQLVETLATRGIKQGIITNKPMRFTTPLIDAFTLLKKHMSPVYSGDTFKEAKPSPLPLLHAAKALGVNASECLYVGDAPRDLEAAKNAGMKGMIASWGYISEQAKQQDWFDGITLGSPVDLLDYI